MHNAEMSYIKKMFEMGDIENLTAYDLQHFIKKRVGDKLAELGYTELENISSGTGQKNRMTKSQLKKWLGSIILLGVTLTLIFSLLGRLTIVKQMKEKILKTFGNE
jgi:hypothetical protein